MVIFHSYVSLPEGIGNKFEVLKPRICGICGMPMSFRENHIMLHVVTVHHMEYPWPSSLKNSHNISAHPQISLRLPHFISPKVTERWKTHGESTGT